MSTEVRPQVKHRAFNAADKARILFDYEAAYTPLERAAICADPAFIAKPQMNDVGRRTRELPKSSGSAKRMNAYNGDCKGRARSCAGKSARALAADRKRERTGRRPVEQVLNDLSVEI